MYHTKEIDFENAIEQDLLDSGFVKADPSNFNACFGIDEPSFWAFLSDTQQDRLDDFIRLNPSDW